MKVSVARKATLLTLSGAVIAGSFAGAAPTVANAAENNTAPPSAQTAAVNPNAACGNQNIAYILDFSASFTDEEMALQKEQAKIAIDRLSKIPGTKISLYNFAGIAPLDDWDVPGGKTGTTKIPQNAPIKGVDISTAEGKKKAMDWIDNTNRHPNGWNYATESTNWDAGLGQVLGSGENYDTVLFSSDGAPNAYIDDTTGERVSGGTGQFDQKSWDEANKTFDKLNDKDTKVVPIFIYDNTDDGFNAYPEMMGKLVKDNPRSGIDYYEGDITKLADNLYSAATSQCFTDLKIDKSMNTKPEDIKPGSVVKYTLTALNDGDWDEKDAVVTDVPVAGFDPKSVKITPSKGTAKGSTWNIGTLKAGEKVTAEVEMTVAQDAKIAQGMSNAVNINGIRDPYNPDGPNKANDKVEDDDDNYDIVKTNVKGDVKVDKVMNTPMAEVKPGGFIEYTLTAKNASAFAEDGIKVTEKPDTGLVADSLEITSKTGKVEGNVWNIGTLKPGEEATATVKVQVAEDADIKAGIANATMIDSPSDPYNPEGPNTPNDGIDKDDDNYDKTVNTVDSDVKVLKVADGAEAKAGENTSWTLTVKNEGKDAATNVWSADMPNAGIDEDSVKFVDKPSTGEIVTGQDLIDNGAATADQVDPAKSYWFVGTLEAGQEATAKVEGKISADATETDNGAIVNSTWDKFNPDAERQDNETVTEDTDNWDGSKTPVAPTPEEPAPPVDPEPTTPAPVAPAPEQPAPEQPAPQADPEVPTAGEKPQPAPAQPQAQNPNTGNASAEDSNVNGGLIAGLGVLLAGLAGVGYKFRDKLFGRKADDGSQG